MIPYWLLFFIPAHASLSRRRNVWPQPLVIVLWIALSLFIGLRHEVGGDWFNYLPYVDRAEGVSFADIFQWGDPGYNLLNWIFANSSPGIYGVNLVSGMIFSAGLLYFCREQPRPWLAFTLAIPYLVIVVAMGYSRQGVALGFLMLGLLALERGHLRNFILWTAAAATFHSTALVMLAFIAPAVPGKSLSARFTRLVFLIIAGYFLVQTFLLSNVDQLVSGYIETAYQSEGATVRVVMNLFPALLLLNRLKSFNLSPQQIRVWGGLAIVAVACAVALLLLPDNTTAIDRLSLYVIPLQLFIASRLPDTHLFQFNPNKLTFLLVSYACLVQYVWLNYAANSDSWLPYSSILRF